jgi:hypothetical protein
VKAALTRIKDLEGQLAHKQWQIDILMLEYCPGEMTQDQIDNWAKHQIPATDEECAELRNALEIPF